MRSRNRYDVETERAIRMALLLVFLTAAVLFAAAVTGCSAAPETPEPSQPGTSGTTSPPPGEWTLPGPSYSDGSPDAGTGGTYGASGGGLVDRPHAEPSEPSWLAEARRLIATSIDAVRTQDDRDALRKADGALVIDEVELALGYLRTVLARNSAVPTVRQAAIEVGKEATRRRAGE